VLVVQQDKGGGGDAPMRQQGGVKVGEVAA
jgi:hypothetical protein